MADAASPPDPPDDAGRLEAALDRIARHRAPAAGGRLPATLAARLDTLIADLRAVLGHDSSD